MHQKKKNPAGGRGNPEVNLLDGKIAPEISLDTLRAQYLAEVFALPAGTAVTIAKLAVAADPVINIPNQNIDNQRSGMQRRILAYLATVGQPLGERIGHLPRTGDVVDNLGLSRDKAGFASVSRSLARLNAAGLIEAYHPSFCTRGKGVHWALSTSKPEASNE
jgi:hypothetical protein